MKGSMQDPKHALTLENKKCAKNEEIKNALKISL
jgi:hypothetical protein